MDSEGLLGVPMALNKILRCCLEKLIETLG